MKILLLNPPKEKEVLDTTTPSYFLNDFMVYPPLGLLAIASEIDNRHEIELLDAPAYNMDIDYVIKHIYRYKPKLLAITVVTRRLYPAYEIAKKIKQLLPELKIVAGGPHIDLFPYETIELDVFDFLLTGFCEKKFPQLLEIIDTSEMSRLNIIPGLYYKIGSKVMFTKKEDEKIKLDDFSFPKRSLINIDDYYSAADVKRMTTMYTSRGCPFRCIFCNVQEKKFHYLSVKRIVDEIESIIDLGIREIHIFDDTFNVMKDRVVNMCKEIINRNLKIKWSTRARVFPFDEEMAYLMKRSGCKRIHVGIESLDENILDFIKKGINLKQIKSFFKLCNEFKIDTLAYFIVGFPQETTEYRSLFFRNVLELKPSYIYLNILYPVPNSEFYTNLVKDGIYKEDYWYNFALNPVPNFNLPLCRSEECQVELNKFVDSIHRSFYLSPRFIINDLKRMPSPKMLFRKAKAGFKLITETIFKNY